MADWTEKYRPTTLAEVRGNDKARDALHEWARTWDDHREAAIVHGSPGVGKTSAAHALAADMGWETMELNASDQRTGDAIKRVAGGAAMNRSLGGSGRQLVILDEADNLHQHKDRGGARAMTDLVKQAGQPVVLLANDYYDMSRGLRGACQEIEFRDVSARSIVPVLRDICRKEGVEYDETDLEAIAATNDGDLRGAVKDLQSRVRDGRVRSEGSEGDRDRTKGIFTFLDAILKEEAPREALRTAYATDETPDDLVLWIEDKAPKVLDAESGELARAYEHIAAADRWLGRVRATQNYSYWRYATDNIAAGVAASRDRTRGGWTRYGGAPYRSSRDSTRDYVAERIAEREGVSVATARREIVPFLSAMTAYCRNRELTVAMAARYDLDAEHVAFVTGSGKSTNKVASIVEDAERRREEAAVEGSGGAFAPGVRDENGDGDGEGTPEAADGGAAAADGAQPEAEGDTVADGERPAQPDGEAEAGTETEEESGESDQQSGLGDFF